LGLDYLRKFDVWGEIMRSAQIAQIRGGFINWDWGFAKVWCVGRKLQDAPVAQIRGGFINWDCGFAKVGCGERNYGARLSFCKNKQSIYIIIILLSRFLNKYIFCKIYYFIFLNKYIFCKIYYFIFLNKYIFCKIYYFIFLNKYIFCKI